MNGGGVQGFRVYTHWRGVGSKVNYVGRREKDQSRVGDHPSEDWEQKARFLKLTMSMGTSLTWTI